LKAAKVLRHTWEDLTGLDELDSSEMEDLRLMFRSMFADHPNLNRRHIQAFFEKNATYILSKTTSDTCVVLYRLLEPFAPTYLSGITLIGDIFLPPLGVTMSAAAFVSLVYESFLFSKRPVPIISGIRPGVLV
jgi:hypothetical protein